MLHYIMELDLQTHKPVRFFQIDLPAPLYEGYKQVVSWNAFFHGTRRKNRNDKFLYTSYSYEEWPYYEGVFYDSQRKIPIIEVDNVWEFYKMIGYDYKTKKYLLS